MNENNQKDIMNTQNNQEIETLDAPVQQTFNQQSAPDNSINSLNNLSTEQTTSVNAQFKKNAKKTPFLIIAAVMIFMLLAGGTGVVVKTKIFDKAPNEITKPGTTDDKDSEKDKEDKNDKDDKQEGGVEIGVPEDGMVYVQIGDTEIPMDSDEAANAGKTPSNYETLEEAITEEDNYVPATQTEVHEFDTFNGAAMFKFSNTGTAYLLETYGADIIISSLVDENNWSLKTEVLRRTYEPLTYTSNGVTVTEYAEPIAYHSQNYLLLKVVKDVENGYYVILNDQMNVIFEGPYYAQSTPKATNNAFYIGSMNCKGKLSNVKTGPVFEIFKFDTKTGKTTYQYNIDYSGEENLCM